MKKNTFLVTSALAFISLGMTSCETPTGQGAGWGAVTGAVLGAAATGDARGAAVGALIGAHTGATIGAMVELDERGYYDGHPRHYYPYARPTDSRGVVQSPIRRMPSSTFAASRAAPWCAIPPPAAFSGSRRAAAFGDGLPSGR